MTQPNMPPKAKNAVKATVQAAKKTAKTKNEGKHVMQEDETSPDVSDVSDAVISSSDSDSDACSSSSDASDRNDESDSDCTYTTESIGWSSYFSTCDKKRLRQMEATFLENISDDDDVVEAAAPSPPTRKRKANPQPQARVIELDSVVITECDIERLRTHAALVKRNLFVTKEQMDLVAATLHTTEIDEEVLDHRRLVKRAVCAAVLFDDAERRAEALEANHASRRERMAHAAADFSALLRADPTAPLSVADRIAL